MAAPKIKQITVHFGGGGKVALQGYGKESTEYGANVSRTYDIPATWTDNQVAIFELEVYSKLQEQVEPLLQMEHDGRMRIQEQRIVDGEFGDS